MYWGVGEVRVWGFGVGFRRVKMRFIAGGLRPASEQNTTTKILKTQHPPKSRERERYISDPRPPSPTPKPFF